MKLIPETVTRAVGNKILQTKINSPHILFAAGVAGVVGSTVLACRATLRLEETLDSVKTDVDAVKTKIDAASNADEVLPHVETEFRKELSVVYTKAAIDVGRLYGPSLALGAVSIAALTGSHIQLHRRNTALTATLAVVSKAYEEYRARIQAELGVERERELYLNASPVERVNEEGKKETVRLTTPDKISPYARFFDDTSPNWCKEPELNRIFLQCQQNYANHLLKARGHVFLNEVYDALGLERTHAGQVVGWVLNGDGDNYVDFGMYDPGNSRFINQHEHTVLLDFNVDGVVYDKF